MSRYHVKILILVRNLVSFSLQQIRRLALNFIKVIVLRASLLEQWVSAVHCGSDPTGQLLFESCPWMTENHAGHMYVCGPNPSSTEKWRKGDFSVTVPQLEVLLSPSLSLISQWLSVLHMHPLEIMKKWKHSQMQKFL